MSDGEGPVTLFTERLVLREFEEDDRDALAVMRSDPEVTRFLAFSPETAEGTGEWLRRAIGYNRRVPRDSGGFAFVRRTDGRVIG